MGLTHFSILKSINNKIRFTVIEPNRTLRAILKKNINAVFYADDSKIVSPFDITLITSPPFVHSKILKSCIKRGDRKVFVEKPFGGHTNIDFNYDLNKTKVFVGYVLRFNPCIQWLKKNIDSSKIKSIHAQYLSNTIEKKPKGWRNSTHSGVLNEMGSHLIDLIQFISNETIFKLKSSSRESVITDIDDIVEAKFENNNKVFSIYLNWVKKEIRKPVFNIELIMQDKTKYIVDQQQIKIYKKGSLEKKVSVTDLLTKVPYYLRGVDFTNQMIDLLGETKIIASYLEAIDVNKNMNQIYNNEDNLR